MGRGSIAEEIRTIMHERGAKTTVVKQSQKKRTFYWFRFKYRESTGEVRVYGDGFILFMLSNPTGRSSEVTRSTQEAIDFISEIIN